MKELDAINNSLVVPAENSTTPVKPEEAKTIFDLIRKYEVKSTLEIGLAYGRSASHIMAATGAPHLAIDPFQDHYGNLGVDNLSRLGYGDGLTLIRDYSHHALPRLVEEKRKFDFIFIDGDHKFDGIFVDFYYSDFLVEEGGLLLFHDTWMRSTELVLQFIRKNREDYRELKVPNRNMALFQKVGEDKRDGMHFREFYNTRSMARHHTTMHMYENPNGLLRKLWLGARKMLGK